jgi:ABC-type transport system involved in multi-copper enzyme maturation permease subunit
LIALFMKELRALLPFAILCALNSADIVTRPFTERLDEQTWVGIASYIELNDGSLGYALAVLTTIVAYAAFPREHDDRTIEFLYGLPVHRIQIFVAKVAAGFVTVWAGLLLLVVTDGIQSTLNPQSISGSQWRLDLALTFAAIQAVFCAVIYAHALLASVFRLFGVIPYVLALFVIAILDDALPFLASTDPTAMLAVQYEGTELVIPWSPIIGHTIIGVCALGLAYAAWMGPADRIGRLLEGAKESAVSKGLIGCGAALAIMFLGVISIGLLLGAGDEEGETNLGLVETAEHPTQRYLFTYPTSHRERALRLIESADAIHADIQRRLGTEQGPQIVADLTEVSGDHLGIASWTHVRVGIVAEPNAVRCRRTFAHETVHAFQHRLSDGRHSDSSATRFFSEGSAEHLAFIVVPGDEDLIAARTMAAAAWTRHDMTIDDLIDDDRLRARYDTTLVYTLGELWTAALVEVHGERAIGDVFRALARPNAPRDLGPRAMWDDTLRAAGCDVSAVHVAFERLVRRVAVEHQPAIDLIPRVGGAVAGRVDGDVRIIAELDRDPQPGWKYFVRLRRGPESSDTEAFGVEGFLEGPRRVEFRVPSELVTSRRFQMMFSVLQHAEGWAWSETWQWATAPR